MSLKSPTTQQPAAEGGGFQPRFPDRRAIGNRCGIFFCGTRPVRLCWAPGTTCPIAIILRYRTAKKPGIATTYYDTTNPAPVEKTRLSALKLEVQEDAKLAQNVGSGLQKRDVGYVRNAEHALHGYATRVIRVPEAHLEANA